MKDTPKVSICIPTYNSETHLEESLVSIENQTYANIEVIISDNCSTDGTIAIVKKFVKKNNWQYFLNASNIGAAANMNKVVSLATGDLIAIYHSDDVYDADIVSKSVKAFLNNPESGFVSTLATVIDSEGTVLNDLTLPKSLLKIKGDLYNFKEIFSAILDSFVPFLITPTVMVPKIVYDSIGGFEINEKYKSAGDYEIWLKILKERPVVIIPESLIKYRKHQNQGSQLEIRENYGLPDGLALYEAYSKGDEILVQKYKRVYSWLLFTQALKLNSAKRFSESRKMIELVYLNGIFTYKIVLFVLNIFNRLHIGLSLKVFKKVKDFVLK